MLCVIIERRFGRVNVLFCERGLCGLAGLFITCLCVIVLVGALLSSVDCQAGNPPLHICVMGGHLQCVLSLLNAGASPYQLNRVWTVFLISCLVFILLWKPTFARVLAGQRNC